MRLKNLCCEYTINCITIEKYIYREVDTILKPTAWDAFESTEVSEDGDNDKMLEYDNSSFILANKS